jgi:signal transduction histidine kinase
MNLWQRDLNKESNTPGPTSLMNLVTTLWSMDAAAALTLAILFGLTWIAERRNLANLMLFVVGVPVAALARAEVGMMHATTVVEYDEWARWFQLLLFIAIVGQVLFVYYYLGTGRLWLMWTAVLSRLAVLGAAFLVHPAFDRPDAADSPRVPFLGELVAVPGTTALRPWQWLAVASCVLVIAFIADAAVRCRREARQGDVEARRRALVVIGAFGVPLMTVGVLLQLALSGLAHGPLLATPAFLITIAVMVFDLSRDALLTRRTQQQLEELRIELARAGRVTALGQLASALAHELSQPLGAILRNAEAAALHLQSRTPDLTELCAIVTDVRTDACRAGDVIDRMRALIKRRTLEMQPLLLNELVQDVFALVRFDAIERHVSLDCAIASELPLVSGDRVHLSQVLLNLIINGMDALQTSTGHTKRVLIGARRGADGKIEVAVTDSGPGISPEVLDKVFDPFFTTKLGGMGMGLPISRTIVEAHGGRLWAEAGTGGRGFTFRFTLPEAPATA